MKKKYKLGAKRLELIMERDYRTHMPHNRIHRILLENRLAERIQGKKKRRKCGEFEHEQEVPCRIIRNKDFNKKVGENMK